MTFAHAHGIHTVWLLLTFIVSVSTHANDKMDARVQGVCAGYFGGTLFLWLLMTAIRISVWAFA